jgi:hypothetical protein
MRRMDHFDKICYNVKFFTPNEWEERLSLKKMVIEIKKLYDMKTVRSLY